MKKIMLTVFKGVYTGNINSYFMKLISIMTETIKLLLVYCGRSVVKIIWLFSLILIKMIKVYWYFPVKSVHNSPRLSLAINISTYVFCFTLLPLFRGFLNLLIMWFVWTFMLCMDRFREMHKNYGKCKTSLNTCI